MSFHRSGVVLNDDVASRIMSNWAEAENKACKKTWDHVFCRGDNKVGERERRIALAFAILEKRATSSDVLSKELGVQKHTISDYLRPFVTEGKLEKRRYGNKSMYSVVRK
jgi:predicted HTH transcriptional regulator